MGNRVTKKNGTSKNNHHDSPDSNSHPKSSANNSSGAATTTSAAIATNNQAQKTSDISRSSSSAELQNHVQFLPLDRLAKMLTDLAQKEESVHGVTRSVFKKYLFPHYPELADKLFNHFLVNAKTSQTYLSQSTFRHQAEKLLNIMNDTVILENYVKMFSEAKDESEITPTGLTDLLMTSYRLSINGNGGSASGLQILGTIDAVVTSCFHGKSTLSVGFVSNWLNQHCSRIVQGLHRHVVHVLTTAYRSGKSLMSSDDSGLHMEPTTPVLDQPPGPEFSQPLLLDSLVWLLSITLPQCYIQNEETQAEGMMQGLISKMSGNPCPRHWTLLYHSDEHGAGANRFLHHVLSYKGPTLTFIKGVGADDEGNNSTFCICSAIEWRETHLYWGNEDSMVLQLLPLFKVIDRGPKCLYLNTSIRGYPQGLRAGCDPKNPVVNVDQSFHSVNFAGVPYKIASIEVWGCGDTKSREKQIEIKKWQTKEVEKQRAVKLSATEWLDHPDRYLLELAGRPNYNNSSN